MKPARRVWWWTVLAVGFVSLAAYGVSVAAHQRRERIDLARQRAERALETARAAAADEWVPADMAEADASLTEARTLDRICRAPVDLIWRVNDAVAAYDRAADVSTRAAATSEAAKRDAIALCDTVLDEAARTVGGVVSVVRSVPVGSPRRTVLQRARLALDEAQAWRRQGQFEQAMARARDAIDLARKVGAHAAVIAGRFQESSRVREWQAWKSDAVAQSKKDGKPAIIVDKEHHRLLLVERGRVAATFGADLGFNWVADKRHAGDGATPEGRYRIVAKKGRGQSQYYKALLIDYPNRRDRAEFASAVASGAIPASASIGGLIEIHGEGGRGTDWTKGCVALANPDLDALFAKVAVGTPVVIVGTDEPGTLAALVARADDRSAGDGPTRVRATRD
ncbi:MAG: L,D-transpeptidase [Vicinamibacterales bacterium]